MIRLAKMTFWAEIKHDWSCGKNISRIHLLRWTKQESAWKVQPDGFRSDPRSVSFSGKRSSGLFWMHGTVCGCAQPPRNGVSQGGTGRMVSSSSSF